MERVGRACNKSPMPRETFETYFCLTPDGWVQGGEKPPNALKVVVHTITDYENGWSVDHEWRDVWEARSPEVARALEKHGLQPVHRRGF
jgi:hypothetical protein